MPPYPCLEETRLDFRHIADHLRANVAVGVPCTSEMIANAARDVYAQVNPDHDGVDDLLAGYPKAQVRNYDGRPEITELDALVAYLQMLGTLVDFSTFEIDEDR